MSTHNDFRILFRHLLPELRPYFWPILASLSITSMVIGADLLQPVSFKWLLDAATVTLNYPVVLQCLLLLLGLAAIRSLLSYWEIFGRSKLGEAISRRYRERVFEHILHLPFATFHEMEAGAMVHRIMHDCGEIGRVYVSTKLLPTITQVVQAIALTGLILALSWQVGLAAILIFPLGWLLSQIGRAHV